MNLTDYAISKGGTGKLGCPVLASAAASAKCSAATLYMVARGHKKVSAALALRVATATGQQVTPADLRPDLYAPAAVTADGGSDIPAGSAPITKAALRARLGLGSDAHLARVLQLPAAEVEAWSEEGPLPALQQVLQLLGVTEQQAVPRADPEDPDAGRIIDVHAA